MFTKETASASGTKGSLSRANRYITGELQTKAFCVKGHPLGIANQTKGGACKKCGYLARREWAKKHPEKIAAYQKKSDLKSKYGLTLEDRERMLAAQTGCCKICAKPEGVFKSPLCVDHDHETGKIRGLLCPSCNHRLIALDDKVWYAKATLYKMGLL